METGATSNRRYNRIGSSSLQARVSDRRATEIPPGEAVAPSGSGNRGAHQEPEGDADRRDEERSALAAEMQLALLAFALATREQKMSAVSSLDPARAYQKAEGEPGDTSSAAISHKISRTV